MQFARSAWMQAINRHRNKADGCRLVAGFPAGGPGKMLKNFTWRNIAIFVIALLIVSYLMMLGAIIAVDRLPYVNWDS
jgi:hypothetical protein